eukprot:TRINITY_DN1714_c0_g1_i4.p1 TRINITY_DN1714_c0_g1~~TRINITY_DN1714_c0_g1_i4.p1  ORF type:complete len:481 (-),score=49.12 TRINITY_DN1714_c0_g1_i4:146-1588(-)
MGSSFMITLVFCLIVVSNTTVLNLSQNITYDSTPMAYGGELLFGETSGLVGCGPFYEFFDTDEKGLEMLIEEYKKVEDDCYVVVNYDDYYLMPNKFYSRVYKIFERVPSMKAVIYASPEQGVSRGGSMYTVDMEGYVHKILVPVVQIGKLEFDSFQANYSMYTVDMEGYVHKILVPVVQIGKLEFDSFQANYSMFDTVFINDEGENVWYNFRTGWPIYLWQISLSIPDVFVLILCTRFIYYNALLFNTATVVVGISIVKCAIYLFQYLACPLFSSRVIPTSIAQYLMTITFPLACLVSFVTLLYFQEITQKKHIRSLQFLSRNKIPFIILLIVLITLEIISSSMRALEVISLGILVYITAGFDLVVGLILAGIYLYMSQQIYHNIKTMRYPKGENPMLDIAFRVRVTGVLLFITIISLVLQVFPGESPYWYFLKFWISFFFSSLVFVSQMFSISAKKPRYKTKSVDSGTSKMVGSVCASD